MFSALSPKSFANIPIIISHIAKTFPIVELEY